MTQSITEASRKDEILTESLFLLDLREDAIKKLQIMLFTSCICIVFLLVNHILT